MEFSLISGVFVPDISGVKKSFRVSKDRIVFSLSAEDYPGFFKKAALLLSEPVFFFVEIPADNDLYRTYYLDNCTLPVASAILKRYGGILFNDGVIRWGFGSHKTDEEIYMREYQTAEIYFKSAERFTALLSSIGYENDPKGKTLWDVLSDKNGGECSSVEYDDETYMDMVNNLIDVGMYSADDK